MRCQSSARRSPWCGAFVRVPLWKREGDKSDETQPGYFLRWFCPAPPTQRKGFFYGNHALCLQSAFFKEWTWTIPFPPVIPFWILLFSSSWWCLRWSFCIRFIWGSLFLPPFAIPFISTESAAWNSICSSHCPWSFWVRLWIRSSITRARRF